MIQLAQQRLVQYLSHQAGLAGAGHAGNAGQCSQRNGNINILQIIFRCAPNRQGVSVALSPGRGNGDFLDTGKILAGDRPGAGQNILQRACGHNFAATAACAGTHIHDEISGTHGILVVLHHNQSVAQIPQLLQGSQQLIVIPLMQADGGLVQNIQHSHQGGANLGSQPNPLAFAAGESSGSPVQGQIGKAHIGEEFQSGLNFPDNLLRNQSHISVQMEIFHEFQFFFNAEGAEIHDSHAAHSHRPGNVGQPFSMAVGTRRGGHTLLHFLSGGIGLGFPEPAGDIVHNALKGLLQHTHAATPVVGHPQLFLTGAVENHLHSRFRQLRNRHRQRKAVLLGQGLKIHPEHAVSADAVPAVDLDGAVQNGLALVGNHQVRVRHQLKAQACTVRAGTGRIVKGEHSGLQLGKADAAVLACIILGKTQLLIGVGQLDHHQSAGMGAGGFDRVRQPAAQALLQHQTVHHQLDGVLFVLFQRNLLCQVIQNPIHPNPGKALLPGILKYLLVLALFCPDHRGQNDKSRTLAQGLHPVYDLVNGLPGDLLAALGTVGNAHPGPQKPQVVVNFRHRAHSGAGVLGGGLLVNGNGR